uniref:Uncharacterized protein n=1 Tax=Oryza punctata TaxID=4537 RepID=A0A0E0M5E3_ORYPU
MRKLRAVVGWSGEERRREKVKEKAKEQVGDIVDLKAERPTNPIEHEVIIVVASPAARSVGGGNDGMELQAVDKDGELDEATKDILR